MSWHHGPLAALDTETTGTDPNAARLVDVALVRQSTAGGAVGTLLDTLVNPGEPIPPEASAVHGITDGDVAEAPTTAAALRELLYRLELLAAADTPVVIYNAPYDLRVIAAELDRARAVGAPEVRGRSLPSLLVVDPLVLDRHADRYRPGKRTLERACEVYGVDLDGAHRARADAVASLDCARKLAERHPMLGEIPPDDLQAVQREAHAVWRDSYNEWRAGKGLDPIDGDWPGVPA